MRCPLLALALLASATSPGRAADLTATKTENAVEFKAGKDVVARYQITGTVPVEKGEGTKPLAKPFLWPVLAPNGVPVTRAWPMDRGGPDKTDHFHQKSVWFCHGDVIPEGIDLKGKHAVDFWSEFPGHGRIVCVKSEVQAGKAAVVTWNEWRTADDVKIMDEERTVTFRELPAGRLFVFEITLKATACPIVFGDTKEGSFGVRVNDAIRTESPTGGVVTAADGTAVKAPAKDNLTVWGKPSDWHDYSGTIDGKSAGIAAFDHPDNPRAHWHTRAYGLMAANPFGRDKSGFSAQKGKTDVVRIEKGKELKLKYAVYAHDGDAKAGQVAEAYEAFKK